MLYSNLIEAEFVSRPNRFIAVVKIGDRLERVHVKNTGRCAELLEPGNTVWLEQSNNPKRKTLYDLVTVKRKDGRIINMDSLAPNRLAREWLDAGNAGPLTDIRSEVTVGDSRFDFAAKEYGKCVLIEVKGCTLERDGIAYFPDAPTERGLKHVRELTKYAGMGCRCIILIVIQMKGVRGFCPNWDTQPEFGKALIAAEKAGVEVIAIDCDVIPGQINPSERVSVSLTYG